MATHSIAFWNLENYFDMENAPASRRPDKVKRAIGKDIVGWTPQLRDQKRDQLAKIIAQLNGGQGPDLIGVCEVENRFVMDRLAAAVGGLAGRPYSVVHADTRDNRGIDVAFLFDPQKFSVVDKFSHFVMRRTATRDLLQVNFRTAAGRLLVVIGNHWPSRSGGAPSESAGYRAIAGETLAYFHRRIWEVHGNDTPVLAMGDFNDEPQDESLIKYADAWRWRTKVKNATSPKFLNLMWPALGAAQASYVYDGFANVLDQFLVNKNLLKTTSPIRADLASVKIEDFPEMKSDGTYPAPIRFGGMGKAVNTNGFSDHYPISMTITES